jgi:Domain of unknown function (DUF4124)
MRALMPLALVLTLAVLPLDGHAQWKWRDAQGRVTVSDRPPPPDVPAGNILAKPPGADQKARPAAPTTPTTTASADGAASAPAKPTGAVNVDPELEARKKKAEQDEAAKVKEAEDKRAAEMRENCQRARSQMASLESGMPIRRVNEKGEREVLDDAQRAAETARTREAIAANCK